jgi:tetratricopeptide (TPR) repeat protein
MMTYSAAWAQMIMGNIVAGEQTARETLEKAQRHNAIGAQGWANLVLAFLAIQTAQWDAADEFGNHAYLIASKLNDADLQSRVLWSRSVCAGWRNDWKRAIEHITESLHTATKDGELPMIYPHLLIQAAKAHFHTGDIENAQSYLDQAMQFAHERQYRQIPAIGQRIQGRILQAKGQFEAAQFHFEDSLKNLSDLNDSVEYARTQEAYGQFLLTRNQYDDDERGQQMLESAHATFAQLGVNG